MVVVVVVEEEEEAAAAAAAVAAAVVMTKATDAGRILLTPVMMTVPSPCDAAAALPSTR